MTEILENENSTTEVIAMQLIAFSGNARSLAFEAFNETRDGNLEEAERCWKKRLTA